MAEDEFEKFSDEELVEEIKRRGVELTVHVSSVEVDISLGGIEFGDTVCTKPDDEMAQR